MVRVPKGLEAQDLNPYLWMEEVDYFLNCAGKYRVADKTRYTCPRFSLRLNGVVYSLYTCTFHTLCLTPCVYPFMHPLRITPVCVPHIYPVYAGL